MSKQAALGAHSVIRGGALPLRSVGSVQEDCDGRGAAMVAAVKTGARLAVKGEAIPSLGYDLHDPNLPFGRAMVVAVPDTLLGAGVSTDMVLPAMIAPVIDKLAAALAERDRHIKALEEQLDTREASLCEVGVPVDAPVTVLPSPSPEPISMKRRLKGLLRRALHGKEVQAMLSVLDDEMAWLFSSKNQHNRWALAGLEHILKDTTDIIVKSRKLIEIKVNDDGFAHRGILMLILYTVAAEKLKSGEFHDDSGSLSLYGRHVFDLWQFVDGQLLASGIATAEETSEARKRVETSIRNVGQ